MIDHLKKEANLTRTENDAVTNASTGSDCLDLFATIGAIRRAPSEEVINRFIRAFTEDKDAALKILFFSRDIRGGLGERKVFRIILNRLAINEPEVVKKNLPYIALFGRYDDYFSLFGTLVEKDMIAYLKSLLEKDLEELKGEGQVSLLAKWLPSINASSHLTIARAKKFIKAFGLTEAAYRKALTALRARIELIENNLRTKDYTFDYGKQPSRAMFKYRQAFTRNDQERYLAFLDNVKKGEAKLHTDNLAPYELIEPYLRDYNPQFSYHQLDERLPSIDASKLDAHVLNVTWEALPDYGLIENVLPIIDTSGSMYMFSSPIPAAVALSLGLYMAEHNKGIFKNHFIQFSEKPELIEIKGSTFTERLRYITTFAAFANTDIEAVFDLILNTAIKNNVPQKELPSKLINVSDMEFDQATENRDMTNFENAKIKFSAHNYKLPEIIFWNVASRNRQQPVTMNEQGVALVSGVTPRIFAMVAGANFSPYTFMMEVLENERYACITA